MSLEDDLKAKAIAIVSQQMATWVVDIQKQIGDHQNSLMRSLDDLVESVARYDEKIDEATIAAGIADVVAGQPAAAGGADLGRLKASLAEIEKGASLSEALTYLVNEAAKHVERAAMFIVKGQSAMGWYARGIEPPEAVKVNVPLTSETVFKTVQATRKPFRGHISQSPGTAQALGRLAGSPHSILGIPLILRDKLAAILYCDSSRPIAPADADVIEVLAVFAAKNIDLLSAVPRPAGATATGAVAAPVHAPAPPPERPAPPGRTGGFPAAAPPPVAAHPVEESSSTVVFNASAIAAGIKAAASGQTTRPAPAPAPRPGAAPTGRPASAEEQKAHEDAKRFARLVVSEIKLYNETKVTEGRRSKDLYERLKEDIERGRQMYSDRVAAPVRDTTNYFYDELVRILAGGDASALGPM